MPDQPTESAPEPGATSVPTPEVSSVSTGQPPSPAQTTDIESLTNTIVGKLDEVIERKLQSTKDKRFRQLEALTGDFQVMQEYLKAANNDPTAAARNYRLDQLLANDNVSLTHPGSVQTAGQQRMSVEEVTSILTDEELSTDDPDVQEWGKKAYASKTDAEVALRRVAAKKRKKSAPGAPPAFDAGSKPPPPPANTDKLNALYADLGVLVRNPVTNKAAIAAKKAEIAAIEKAK